MAARRDISGRSALQRRLGYRPTVIRVHLLLLASACSGEPSPQQSWGDPQPAIDPQPTGEPRPNPAPSIPFPDLVDFTCSVGFGVYTADSFTVDFAARTYWVAHVRVPQGEPHPARPPPRPLDDSSRARFESLVRAVIRRTDWQSDPAIPDGVACSVSLYQGTTNPTLLYSVQRQETRRGDDVDRLIEALRALGP